MIANDLTVNIILQRDAKAGEMVPVRISDARLECRMEAHVRDEIEVDSQEREKRSGK